MGISERRKRIEQLDRLLVDVLHERFEVAKSLARDKREQEMSIEDSGQEEAVLDRAEEYAKDEDVRDVFEVVIETTKKKMRESNEP